jgi:hypothetical protein
MQDRILDIGDVSGLEKGKESDKTDFQKTANEIFWGVTGRKVI